MAEKEKSCSSASSCTRESCEGCPSKKAPASFQVDANAYSDIKHVIGIVSGKGGVGKSMVTASAANLLASRGYRVGILDADITGPSIPKMYGLHGPAVADDQGIYPMLTENDIKVISVNLMMPDEEAPVIWRGPVIAGMVKQFWSDVIWGELDYLLVDMPPGTGDVPLTVFQSLPVDGIVIVTSPQELVQMIVKKAYNMAKTMNIPVLGIVENYSWLTCPDCGRKISVFGESHIDEIAGEMGLQVLGKMPIDPEFAALADGHFAQAENPYLEETYQALRALK
ncbi:MAG: Mrp/NBP35 family ATP-binding protein [Eubacteriales bacterium]|nr:Mrp/NBP35 family ATP-binding protein [Eubacteriales bacterium]